MAGHIFSKLKAPGTILGGRVQRDPRRRPEIILTTQNKAALVYIGVINMVTFRCKLFINLLVSLLMHLSPQGPHMGYKNATYSGTCK